VVLQLGGLGEVLTTTLRKKRMLRNTHVEMLSLETKQSGGKLLSHSNLREGGVFLEEVSQKQVLQVGFTLSLSHISTTNGRRQYVF
jgi:hypothetical protein